MGSPSIKKLKRWPRRNVGRLEYLHALGVLIASFNRLEISLGLLFRDYVPLSEEAIRYLFSKLDNAARAQLIQACVPSSNHSKRVKSGVSYFLKGFAMCAANRNILAHAHALPMKRSGSKTELVMFFKSARKSPFMRNSYSPTLVELRAAADAMYAFSDYGDRLHVYIWRSYDFDLPAGFHELPYSWPKRPALPKFLVPR